MTEKMKFTLFFAGNALLILVELLRWLAGMPPETCTAISAIGTAMISTAAVAFRGNGKADTKSVTTDDQE